MTTEVKLFRFTRQHLHWHYTSADRVIELDGQDFLPAPISHTGITDGGDANKVSIRITLPRTLPVAANWWPWPPGDVIVATIWTKDVGEDQAFVDWIGRVVAPQFTGNELTLVSEPNSTTARRGGKGRVLGRGCDHILFSAGCGVDPADHALPATLDGVAGLTLAATAFLALPSGRLAGGWIEWEREDGLIERRSIAQHTGNAIVIDYGADELAPDLEVTAYPGCAQTWEDCEYYENTENYGGWLYRPTRNFYDGNPVR